MAYAIDQLALILGISPFAFAIFAISGDSGLRSLNTQLLVPIIAFASLIVPALYLLAIYRGWSSIGRYLFQLRIVEEHGLPPRREQLVPREVLRNAFAWCFPLALYVSLRSETLSQVIEFALIGFMAINTITLFLLQGRKALHDPHAIMINAPQWVAPGFRAAENGPLDCDGEEDRAHVDEHVGRHANVVLLQNFFHEPVVVVLQLLTDVFDLVDLVFFHVTSFGSVCGS
jgi:uncharacterized RDD family membrane protein YckC